MAMASFSRIMHPTTLKKIVQGWYEEHQLSSEMLTWNALEKQVGCKLGPHHLAGLERFARNSLVPDTTICLEV